MIIQDCALGKRNYSRYYALVRIIKGIQAKLNLNSLLNRLPSHSSRLSTPQTDHTLAN